MSSSQPFRDKSKVELIDRYDLEKTNNSTKQIVIILKILVLLCLFIALYFLMGDQIIDFIYKMNTVYIFILLTTLSLFIIFLINVFIKGKNDYDISKRRILEISSINSSIQTAEKICVVFSQYVEIYKNTGNYNEYLRKKLYAQCMSLLEELPEVSYKYKFGNALEESFDLLRQAHPNTGKIARDIEYIELLKIKESLINDKDRYCSSCRKAVEMLSQKRNYGISAAIYEKYAKLGIMQDSLIKSGQATEVIKENLEQSLVLKNKELEDLRMITNILREEQLVINELNSTICNMSNESDEIKDLIGKLEAEYNKNSSLSNGIKSLLVDKSADVAVAALCGFLKTKFGILL